MLPLTLFAALWLLLAAPACAHELGEADLQWSFSPWLVTCLAFSLVLYGVGWLRLRRRSRTRLRHAPTAQFLSGWITLVAATLSPLHAASGRSFALHMLEHEILMLVAAPLLVLSRPLGVMLWAFPRALRGGAGAVVRKPPWRAGWRTITDPVVATLVQAAALWLWHTPALFDLALLDDAWHIAQHATFFASALLFWQAMAHAIRQPSGLGSAVFCLFATSLIAGLLGALMAFSDSPWYRPYQLMGMAPFGLTPTEDQQLAGLLMWIPGGMVHIGAALFIIARVLREQPATGAPRRS